MAMRRLARQLWLGITSRSSGEYWERRYAGGMTSGPGSYGELAEYKARILNDLVRSHDIRSVIEFGCGDGHQLSLARYPRYLGLDVSRTAIDTCIARFRDDATKSFLWYDPQRTVNFSGFVSAELVLSLDVVYHLLEDATYQRYLADLFLTARKYVVIYSSNMTQRQRAAHVCHREFTADVARRFPDFTLLRHLENPLRAQTFADFYIYGHKDARSEDPGQER